MKIDEILVRLMGIHGFEYQFVKENFYLLETRNYAPKRKLVFQPSIFRCYVSFRECTLDWGLTKATKKQTCWTDIR